MRYKPDPATMENLKPFMNAPLPKTGRIEAFSDGVIAIIITIMVLEPRLPEHSVANGLWAGLLTPLLPRLIPYLLSFLVIAIMWVNHHQFLHAARKATPALLWSNIHLLLWMSLIPVATAVVGEDPFVPLSIATYGFVLTANASAFILLRWCVSREVRDDDGLMREHASVMRKNLSRSRSMQSRCRQLLCRSTFRWRSSSSSRRCSSFPICGPLPRNATARLAELRAS